MSGPTSLGRASMTDRRHTVIVEPVAAGWSVQVGCADNPMVFASGRAAEKAGRDLALRLADAGSEVELELKLRGGATAAKFICFPRLDSEDMSLMMRMPPLSAGPVPGH